MNIMKQMKLFMEPRSIAIVGVTRSAGVGAFDFLRGPLDLGFAGKIYPINPKAEEISGLKAYPNVKAIPEDIDLAVIATPRDTVPPLVRDCVEKGIKAIIVIAQGFADADEEGKALQAQIVKIAKEGGARIIGPNTFGVTNIFNNSSSTPGVPQMERNPIGVISQTGLFFIGLPRLKFGKIIDLGNACDIDLADALAYFEDDPDIRVIVLHIEGIQEGKKFLQVANRVAREKPVIALKGGKSETGAQAVQSHTGSLIGKDEVYEAAFSQCGIIRASDAEELEDLSLAFLRLPRTKAVNRISQLAPPWLPIHNPIDLWASTGLTLDPGSFKERIRIVLEALLTEENADAVMVIIQDFVEMFGEFGDISSLFLDAADTLAHRPLIFSIIGAPGKLTAKLEQNNRTVVFASPERGVRALSKLWSYTQRFKGT